MNMEPLVVGILLFDEVEVLDFAGPFEVFSLAELDHKKLFNAVTIGQKQQMIAARNGLKVFPDYDFNNHPSLDILIIPGGYGAEHIEINNKVLLAWIKSQKKSVRMIASVCTGAFLLAEAGLLDELWVTTHHLDQKRLQEEYPKLTVLGNKKFVDQGDVLTSGGISAGIDMSFHIVQKLFGKKTADDTRNRMEYNN